MKTPPGTSRSPRQRKRGVRGPVAGKQAVGWNRLRNLVLGLPPAALAGTPAYARYQALLPQMLAQTVAPGSADYQWFMTFIAQWDECLAEYQDLQRAFADDE